MKKAFFVNGGAGRMLCSIPALEYYCKNINNDAIIVSEAWTEIFLSNETLRTRVFPVTHHKLFEDYLKDREIVTLEPYRLNAYYNQKANLIQAFDMIVNELSEVPKTKDINLTVGKADSFKGKDTCMAVRQQLQKDKVIVFQPFGQAAKMVNNTTVIDESGRSFEVDDIIKIVNKLGQHFGVLVMSNIDIPSEKPIPAVMPEQMNLLQWMGVIQHADYFLGCDSVGQHFANALGIPATVVIGSTYPENISYPANSKFKIIDNGKDKRIYSPIRISEEFTIDRNNENLMQLDDAKIDQIVNTVLESLGQSTASVSTFNPQFMNAQKPKFFNQTQHTTEDTNASNKQIANEIDLNNILGNS